MSKKPGTFNKPYLDVIQLTSGISQFYFVDKRLNPLCRLPQTNRKELDPGGGGVTTISAGTGCAIFWSAFFRAKMNFGESFLLKSQVVKFWGVILENNSLGH